MSETWLARLAEDGMLLGFDEAPAEIPEGAVTVPIGCDLQPGKYRWDGTTFVPIGRGDKALKEKLEQGAPMVLWFFVREFAKAHPSLAIPRPVKEWTDAYRRFAEPEESR